MYASKIVRSLAIVLIPVVPIAAHGAIVGPDEITTASYNSCDTGQPPTFLTLDSNLNLVPSSFSFGNMNSTSAKSAPQLAAGSVAENFTVIQLLANHADSSDSELLLTPSTHDNDCRLFNSSVSSESIPLTGKSGTLLFRTGALSSFGLSTDDSAPSPISNPDPDNSNVGITDNSLIILAAR